MMFWIRFWVVGVQFFHVHFRFWLENVHLKLAKNARQWWSNIKTFIIF